MLPMCQIFQIVAEVVKIADHIEIGIKYQTIEIQMMELFLLYKLS